MARSKNEIKSEMTAEFMANKDLQEKYKYSKDASFENTFSKINLESIFFGIVAAAIMVVENLFDLHKKEVDTMLQEQKRGSLSCYRTMALNFQYGFPLITDSDRYNNTGFTDDQIKVSKIVKYAAVNESQDSSRVIIKIATEKDGTLAPISDEQKESFEAYIKEVKFAGVKTTVINYLPDRLYLNLKIIRDPLVLDGQGNSIVNGGRPVETAIKEYLKELPFNGMMVLAHLIDKLQLVEGVIISHLVEASSSFIDPITGDYQHPQPIDIRTIPVSGYYEVSDFNNITYVV